MSEIARKRPDATYGFLRKEKKKKQGESWACVLTYTLHRRWKKSTEPDSL